jgi:pilus assembly protein CpaB
MGRRTILLVVAALIAVLGSGMVFLYVKGADDRAKQAQVPVRVLKAVAQIEPGETLGQAQSAGKLQLAEVPTEQVLDGAMSSIGDSAGLIALARVYPNEQITSSKFGSPGEQDVLTLPDGMIAISVNLTDTGRVAGFVSPGSNVALFDTATPDAGPGGTTDPAFTRLLLPKVEVVAVAQTTVTTSTTTDEAGAQTTEQLPKTLFTLAVDQAQAERIMYAAAHGELSFGLLNDKSKVHPGPGVTFQNLFR